MVWEDEVEKVEHDISTDNDKRILSAVSAFGGDILVSADRPEEAGVQEYIGQPLDEEILRKILTPGVQIKMLTIKHDDKEIDIVIGRSAFRKKMEGLRLETGIKSGKLKLNKGMKLGREDLKKITSGGISVICVRDRELLDSMKNVKWTAEDVIAGDRRVVPHDVLISDKYASDMAGSSVRDVKVWSSVEHIDIVALMRKNFDSKEYKEYLGREIFEDGEATGRLLDMNVFEELASGSITQVEFEDEDSDEGTMIFSRAEIIRKLLAAKLKNKILQIQISSFREFPKKLKKKETQRKITLMLFLQSLKN